MLTRTPLLVEALQVRRQSSKERMAKKRPSATFGAKRAAKWLWQQERKKWSKKHPQYIFRKGKLIFVPPEKRRQLKSKIKGRVVKRAKLPGSGRRG
jgi:nickel-dependent lactate racemase